MRKIVIGDIHGCYEELLSLLDKVNYDPASDTLVSCGDLTEKGPKSEEVCQFFSEGTNKLAVQGNHDEGLVRFWNHEKKKVENPHYRNPMALREERLACYRQMSEKSFLWLSSLPFYLKFSVDEQQYIVVHGGLFPGTPPEKMDPKVLCRLRYVREHNNGWRMVQLGKEQSGDCFWAEVYDGSFGVVLYGHQPYNGEHKKWAYARGLDSGACYGYTMTALLLAPGEEEKYVSVPCEKYSQPWSFSNEK